MTRHVDYDDGAPESIRLSHRLRRARKAHTCTCCGGPINPGENYWYSFYLVDGEPWSEKLCRTCPYGY